MEVLHAKNYYRRLQNGKKSKQIRKLIFLQERLKKEKIKVEASTFNEYIFVPKSDEVDLIDKIKTRVRS